MKQNTLVAYFSNIHGWNTRLANGTVSPWVKNWIPMLAEGGLHRIALAALVAKGVCGYKHLAFGHPKLP